MLDDLTLQLVYDGITFPIPYFIAKDNITKYDPELQKLLTNNNFNYINIFELLDEYDLHRYDVNKKVILSGVNYFTNKYNGGSGCIFTLPSEKCNIIHVYHTKLTSAQIRQRLALKAFL